MGSRKIDSWFLGIDLGTGSCKTVVIDDMAQVLGHGAAEYPGDSVHEKWQEQEPEGVLSGMVASVRRALDNAGDLPGNCAGISIGGALHSVMAVDSSGSPLTGIMTWGDGRAIQQSMDIKHTPVAEAVYQQTGCPVHGMYPVYKIRLLKEKHPQIFEKAARFLSAKEYVVHRLIHQYVVDYSVASGSGLLNTHNLAWSLLSLDLAHIRQEQLSEVIDPKVIFAGLDPELARQMGLSPSTRLILGSSDAANSSIGAGAVRQHQATCMIGTSGAFRVITPNPILDAHVRTWCYAIDSKHWLTGGSINNGGIALSWLRDLLNRSNRSLHPEQLLSFSDLLALAGSAPLGADGLVCLPFFTGERSPNWNLDSRAVFFGLSLEHEAQHLARALLEGIAFRMLSIKEILSEMVGDIREVRASGGYTQSPFWLQLMTDVLNCEIQVSGWGETSSLGAAIWSLLGTGVFSGLEEIPSHITTQERFQPNPSDAQKYQILYSLYKSLYQAVRPSFGNLAAIKSRFTLEY
jgi:gluconokinase